MSGTGRDPLRALEDERRRAQARLAALSADHAAIVAASEGSNADDEHDPEGSTIAFEPSQVAALTDQARRQLGNVEAALARVREGTYGVCETCHQPIPKERLEARLAADQCVGCASRR